MVQKPRLPSTDLLLLVSSAGAVGLGLLVHFEGPTEWARWIWIGGSLPVLLALLIGIAQRAFRRDAGLDLIALLSICGALVLGEHLTGAVIALMLASGRALEDYAEARARHQMSALLSRAPRNANRYEDSGLVQIPVSMVEPGDHLLVRAGELVPVDGTVESGTAILDESTLTGEMLPLRRESGQLVRSGSANSAGPFNLLATTRATDSTYASVVRLVEAAQRAKAPAARLADRYALLFVPISLALAAAAWIISGDPIRGLAVLVVATPCPLILAVPVAIVSGISRSAGRGVLVKGGGVLEKLAQAKTLFIDKTGTLTHGRARLVSLEAAPNLAGSEVLRVAASLDQVSQHVIAQAVVSAARARGLVLSSPSRIEEQPGAGLRGIVDGHEVAVGSHAYVSALVPRAAWGDRVLQKMGYEGAVGVFVAMDGNLAGALLLFDEIRLDAPRALRLLRKAGVERIVMLTGDHRVVADIVGTALGVDEVLADCTPADKVHAVQASRRLGTTLMVGDGVNDAPALAAADVGVAMGAHGTAASSEVAGVVLLVDRLDRLADALNIARHTRSIAIQSAGFGMGLSLLAMGVAAPGYLPPLAGAILQQIIDVLVILNALRALGKSSSRGRSGALEQARVDRLAAEHTVLLPVLERVRTTADALTTLTSSQARTELIELVALLRNVLLPHERSDDTELYPEVAQLLGGDDPLAPMNRAHREVARLTHLLSRTAEDLPAEGPDPAMVQELQRNLYGLEAILRLHFAQEDEIYHALAEAA